MILQIDKENAEKTSNLTSKTTELNTCSIFLIDSEILREPFGQRYNHAQDQKARSGCWEKIDRSEKLGETSLYAIIDYEKIKKSKLLSERQARLSCGFLLHLYPRLVGCFLCLGDKGKIFLYSRIIEKLKQENSDFCFNGQSESTLPIKSDPKLQAIEYLQGVAQEIFLVSDLDEDKQLACDRSFSYLSSSYWFESHC